MKAFSVRSQEGVSIIKNVRFHDTYNKNTATLVFGNGCEIQCDIIAELSTEDLLCETPTGELVILRK